MTLDVGDVDAAATCDHGVNSVVDWMGGCACNFCYFDNKVKAPAKSQLGLILTKCTIQGSKISYLTSNQSAASLVSETLQPPSISNKLVYAEVPGSYFLPIPRMIDVEP